MNMIAHLDLPIDYVANLSPEVRDLLLAYLQRWGTPDEQLAVVSALCAVHGPLLFLLDYQAQALLSLGRPHDALAVIERRQRRNTTIGSQVLEVVALLGAGHAEAARTRAAELGRSYPRHGQAVIAAAETAAALGDADAALKLLTDYLAFRPGDQAATLAAAGCALRTGRTGDADRYLQRMGAGVPPGAPDDVLQRLHAVATALRRQETIAAVELELGRRRLRQFAVLRQALRPFVAAGAVLDADPAAFYRHFSGIDALPVSPAEHSRIESAALHHFGFPALRPGQAETIAAVLRGESVLMVMSTGGGKSLCYQLPALMLPRATLVISPLIALMKDQVEGLPPAAQSLATFINSSLAEGELQQRLEAVARGEYKLIYAAPERLRQRSFLRALAMAGIDLFVVDEAHCVSMWGHDFRPDYLFLREAREELGAPTALAMTATAPPRVRDEIVDHIGRADVADDTAPGAPARPRVLVLDVFRPNLHLSALSFRSEDEKLAALIDLLQRTPGSGIVYVSTRHKARLLSALLRAQGIDAEHYHAGLAAAERSAVQDRFMNDQTRVIVATIAFGMGIDKPDIRFVVHFHPSRSLDAYYQEVGRAGRDGKRSEGVLFYSQGDWSNLRRWAHADELRLAFLEKVYAATVAQLSGQAAEGAAIAEPTSPNVGPVDMRRLLQVLTADDTEVRVAISLLERAGLLSRGFDLPLELTIDLPRQIAAAAERDRAFVRLRKGLALGPGQRATFATVDLGAFMRWPLHEVESRLLVWHERGWLRLLPGRRAMQIELLPGGDELRPRLERLLTQSAALAQRRIDDMIGYATAETCRHGYISTHFGSQPRARCEVCDVCTGVQPAITLPERVEHLLPDDADIEPLIADCLLSLPKPVGRSGLARILAGALRAPVGPDKARHHGALKAMGEGAILETIDALIDEGWFRQYERQGYPVLAATLSARNAAESWLAQHPELAAYGAPSADTRSGATAAVETGPAEEPESADTYTNLQKALWLWRRRLAEQLGQPPYVVMTNELMLNIACARPQTLEELGLLAGMGSQRLQHYGAAILDIVKLNPLQEGDDARLATQVAARTVAQQQRQTERSAQVAPQLERAIFLRLQEIRQRRAHADGSRAWSIANDSLLRLIARHAPATLADLNDVPGFSDSGLVAESTQIVTIITALKTRTP